MTKKEAKIIFLSFSILLILDLLVLPVIFGIISHKSCEYGTIICIGLSLVPLLLFGFFWCALWNINRIVFFTNDHKKEEVVACGKNFLTQLYVRHIQNMYVGKFAAEMSLITITIIFCFGAVWLFVYEIYQFFKI